MTPTHILLPIKFWNELIQGCEQLPDGKENAFAKDIVNMENKQAIPVCLTDEEIEKIRV